MAATTTLQFSPFYVKPPKTPDGLIAYRPDAATVAKTAARAKAIFVEAFTTSYTAYHQASRSPDSIETWLRLNPKFKTFQAWIEATFDDEYAEYLAGDKGFIHLIDCKGDLVGWLSHGKVEADGTLYLSQCSLEADWRNLKVASTAFAEAINKGRLQAMFPGITEVKLIARRINTIAETLYTHAGFTRDETIDPAIYGEAYDDRYVGYRLQLSQSI